MVVPEGNMRHRGKAGPIRVALAAYFAAGSGMKIFLPT